MTARRGKNRSRGGADGTARTGRPDLNAAAEASRLPRALAFAIRTQEERDGWRVLGLQGFADELEFDLTLEIRAELQPGQPMFQGPALVFRSCGAGSDTMIEAFERKLGVRASARSLKPSVAPFELCTFSGDATRLATEPVRFKGYLKEGIHFLLDVSIPGGFVVLAPREGDEQAFLGQLVASR